MKRKIVTICKENKGILFILPSLFGVSLFFLLPYLEVIKQSVSNPLASSGFGLSNYKTVVQNEAFRLAILNTAKFIGVCLPVLLSLSLGFALILKQSTTLSNLIKTGFLFPLVIPIASVAFFWKLTFEKQGFLNLIVSQIGGPPVDWMNSDSAFWILVFTYVWKNLGYNLILWLAGLSGIPTVIYEAARVDGASKLQMFFKITLPNLLPTFFIVTVLSLLNTFKIFREAYLVAGEYPHQSMYLIQHVFNNWFREMDVGKIAAGSILNTAIMMLFIVSLQKRME